MAKSIKYKLTLNEEIKFLDLILEKSKEKKLEWKKYDFSDGYSWYGTAIKIRYLTRKVLLKYNHPIDSMWGILFNFGYDEKDTPLECSFSVDPRNETLRELLKLIKDETDKNNLDYTECYESFLETIQSL